MTLIAVAIMLLLSCASRPLGRSTASHLTLLADAHLPCNRIRPSYRVFSANQHLHDCNKSKRHKLHIGFTSLSANTNPFSSTENAKDPSSLLDPRASIMLTALRGGVLAMDCPAPPLLDGSGSFNSPLCWIANRQSEIDTADSLDVAWKALEDEDDGEAISALYSEGAAVTITTKLGFRAAVSADGIDDDVKEMEGKFEGDAKIGVLDPGTESSEEDREWAKPPVALVHNLSREYALHSLRTSPLVERYKLNNRGRKKFEIISLAHNPETQISAYLVNCDENITDTKMERAHEHMKQSLTSAFVGYEMAVKEGLIDGYGVDSNGLSLPQDHDMHYGWGDVLECATDAYLQVYGPETNGTSSLKVIRMPGNLLETRGLKIAQEIHSFFSNSEEALSDDLNLPDVDQKRKLRQMRKFLPQSIEVNITRPLTAFPYGGTCWEPNSSPGLTESSGAPPLFLEKRGADGKKIDSTHPIRILDYRVESGPMGQIPHQEWSNYHYNHHGSRPSLYHGILNAALSHFDADSILEASKERELTVEERETLDGCKLLRDLIHDLDASVDTMKSFAAYEEYLVNVAVPVIYGSFEGLDDESAALLQAFFTIHGTAVRMVVARWTRELLLGGWKKVEIQNQGQSMIHEWDTDKEKDAANLWQKLGLGQFPGGYKIPEDMTLQEFSLKYLLDDESIHGIVVGCSRPEHVLEALKAADSAEK